MQYVFGAVVFHCRRIVAEGFEGDLFDSGVLEFLGDLVALAYEGSAEVV